ncbi:formylglycine-generating enzyme family protein [bacterium]|nr:formylglycine-generating enzyme family protein [bacterium]
MKKLTAIPAVLVLLGLGISAQAVTIDTVTVGDPGNGADTADHSGNPNGQGSVSYTYNIGKYEVTAGQYTAFLNAVAGVDTFGLYNTSMWSNSYGCKIERHAGSGTVADPYQYRVAADWANRPVNYVSYWDSCRFANWLSNGQKAGAQDATTTEDGTYTLNGYNSVDGRNIQRNTNWKWAITSEDEWYKAAYYKGGGTDAGYWLYPTQSDATPSNQLVNPTDPGNNANFYQNGYTIGNPYYLTEVGEFENSESAYGTFDQGGNVQEVNEGIAYQSLQFVFRSLRGGSFYNNSSTLQPSFRDLYDSTWEDANVGFRVSQAVPEPSSIIPLLGGLTGLIGLKRRKA